MTLRSLGQLHPHSRPHWQRRIQLPSQCPQARPLRAEHRWIRSSPRTRLRRRGRRGSDRVRVCSGFTFSASGVASSVNRRPKSSHHDVAPSATSDGLSPSLARLNRTIFHSALLQSVENDYSTEHESRPAGRHPSR
ncbi:hypothetical protein BD311DRAFT_768826 [Dichomitus squalens]|uniref:Uncharacterized protein n=1 Tax=Dichomitus squalens TaxID=114155 RepID=A0A4Q9MBV2_9APHY|nr:hypothetical protein BD311DRAFT_768826 [Dichomitus squalens]